MQIVELSLDHPYLYCPVTGQVIVDGEDAYESPALAFTYIEEVSEFGFVKPELQKIYDECVAQRDEADEDEVIYVFDLFLEKIKDFENHVLFSITTFGFACGPVSSTVHYCFDMNYDIDEEIE